VQKLGLRIRTLPLILSVSRRETRMMDRIPASTADIVRFAASVLPDKQVSVLRSRQAADKWIDERDGQVRPGASSLPPPPPGQKPAFLFRGSAWRGASWRRVLSYLGRAGRERTHL
jgi:hypothetical protein